jgi:5-methylcytosine-specific restriction endonuclease McrBC regulatory subunit McrC
VIQLQVVALNIPVQFLYAFRCLISAAYIFSIADLSSTAFIRPLPLIDFVMEILNKDNRQAFRSITTMEYVKVSIHLTLVGGKCIVQSTLELNVVHSSEFADQEGPQGCEG